ncbi:hypothetical protein T439DRAFT_324147 [Meredithblackwellia eburnea MCA 4105]
MSNGPSPATSQLSVVSGGAAGEPHITTTSPNGGVLVHSTTGTPVEGAAVARPFRSRKQRPCDACRKQKNRCAITVVGEPCVECKQTGKECTFIAPVPQRKAKDPQPPQESFPIAHGFAASTSQQEPDRLETLAAVARGEGSHGNPASTYSTGQVREEDKSDRDTLRPSKRMRGLEEAKDGSRRERSSSSTRIGGRLANGLFSLEDDCPSTTEPCAITSMLTDDLLPVRSLASAVKGDETAAAGHRQVSSQGHAPMFFMLLRKPSHRIRNDDFDRDILRRLRSAWSIFPQPFDEDQALTLYLNSSHAAFPVLPLPTHAEQPQLDSLPPSLLALVLATSLDHSPTYNFACRPIWELVKEARVGERSLELPKLSGVATALLELGARPVLDERGDFLLLAKTIAQAQLLGLHISSEDWAIPRWEKNLRLRLWWCIRIHDGWSSFLNSRPSHLQIGNSSVRLPSLSCLVDEPTNPSTKLPQHHNTIAFHYLCRLAVQVSRFQSDLCTIDNLRAAKAAPVEAASFLKSVEKELAALESETRYLVNHPLDGDAPPGAYCFRFMLLGFKCMVRRVSIELKAGIGGAFKPDADTLFLFGDLVEFVSSLKEDAFHGYWLPYSCHVLSSAVSSLIRLSLASISSGPHSNTPAITIHSGSALQPVRLLQRLCLVLAQAREHHKWDVSYWALSRAANVAARLRTVASMSNDAADNYQTIVNALEGRSTREPTPVVASVPAFNPSGFNAATGLEEVLRSAVAAQPTPAGGELGSTVDLDVPVPESDGLNEIRWNINSLGVPDLDQWLNELNAGDTGAMAVGGNNWGIGEEMMSSLDGVGSSAWEEQWTGPAPYSSW